MNCKICDNKMNAVMQFGSSAIMWLCPACDHKGSICPKCDTIIKYRVEGLGAKTYYCNCQG